jgi:hydroxymethylbilane synthase
MRGNVDTRLRKVDGGEFDAIVLARAGLVRLGLEGRTTEILSPETSVPAPGQGALGVECREGDTATRALLARLDDPETALCVAAERGALEAVGGDCKTPLGAHAVRQADSMYLRVFMADSDGTNARTVERRTAWPSESAEARTLGLDLGWTIVRKSE